MKIHKPNLVIKFASFESDIHPIPKPAKLSIPEWYKDSPLNLEGTNLPIPKTKISHTYKRCVPFLDSLVTGYVAELWQDIIVRKKPDGLSTFEWRTKHDPLEERPLETSMSLPVPAGHSIQRLAWKVPYVIQTPKNHSILITHPFNRFDLPFTTLSGVVDCDETVMGAGNIPFFIKNDFEGVIEKGTPIFQVIPFQRENWDSEEDNSLLDKSVTNNRKTFAVISGWYKQNVWKRKSYL